jgi:UDP-glucose 4-epimerase
LKEKQKILITGSSGFIGANLLNTLKSENFDIAVIDRSNNPNLKNVTKYVGDICDYSFVEKAVLDFQPGKVFHLAGYKNRASNVEELSLSLRVNLMGTLNLYQALTKVSALESIIALGTTDEYGIHNSFRESSIENPISPYGFSKLCGTQLAQFFYRSFNLPVIILRPTIAYGPHQANDMFIPSLINTLIVNKDFKMTEGNQLRDFIYISDLVEAMLVISENQNCNGEIFNVGYGESLMLKDVASTIASDLNKEHLLKLGSIPYRQNEVMKYATCIDKFCKKTGWIPKVSFKKGIELTVKHYKDNVQ